MKCKSPNATVYKSVIRNFTTIKNRREDFTVSVPRHALDEVQQRAIDVLKQHPAVLSEPEPAVLVDALGETAVTLRVYFWLDGKENSWLKVRSSVMRLVLHAVDDHAPPAAKPAAAERAHRRVGDAPKAHREAPRQAG